MSQEPGIGPQHQPLVPEPGIVLDLVHPPFRHFQEMADLIGIKPRPTLGVTGLLGGGYLLADVGNLIVSDPIVLDRVCED
jgi:hypothetical protein